MFTNLTSSDWKEIRANLFKAFPDSSALCYSTSITIILMVFWPIHFETIADVMLFALGSFLTMNALCFVKNYLSFQRKKK